MLQQPYPINLKTRTAENTIPIDKFMVSPLSMLRRTASVLDNIVRERTAKEFGLNPTQVEVLLVFQNRNTVASDIARLLAIDCGAVSRIVEYFVRENVIVRKRSFQDHRVVHLQLTVNGTRLFRRIEAFRRSLETTILDGICDKDRSTLIEVVKQIMTNCETAAAYLDYADTASL